MGVFDFVFELMAFFDLGTDLVFVWVIYHSEHNAWFTISLYTMISPYFDSYIAFLNYQLDKIYNELRNSKNE